MNLSLEIHPDKSLPFYSVIVYFNAEIDSSSLSGVLCPRCGSPADIVGSFHDGSITNALVCDCSILSKFNIKKVSKKRFASLIFVSIGGGGHE